MKPDKTGGSREVAIGRRADGAVIAPTGTWASRFGLIWTPADTGLHTIRVVLDATHRYAELDETGATLFDRRQSLLGGTFFPDIHIDTVRFVPPAAGDYAFRRSVDPDAEFQDADRTNDVMVRTLTVTR